MYIKTFSHDLIFLTSALANSESLFSLLCLVVKVCQGYSGHMTRDPTRQCPEADDYQPRSETIEELERR